MAVTNNQGKLQDTLFLLYIVNFGIILFYSMLCPITILRICSSFGAHDFLMTAGNIPQEPWTMARRSLFLFIVLIAICFFRARLADASDFQHMLLSIAEIFVCAGVITSLNFYYSGIALPVLADLVYHTRDNSRRVQYMFVLIMLFALGQYDIVPFAENRIPFSAYLGYYSPQIRGCLSGIVSVLASLNVLLFVYFMVLLFAGQKAENKRILNLYDQLKAANERLRDYARELEHMTEIRERNRLAREIHDTLGHTLTGIIMGTEASLALFDKAPENARERMEVVAQSARDGLTDVRQSIKALRPDTLEKHSLEKALENMINNFHLTTSVLITYEQEAGNLAFANDEEDAIYRVVQECMTNAVRHGHATQIAVRMTRQEDVLIIDIRDNGLGCEKVTEGFGLRHMQERLGLLGGSLTYGNRSIDIDDGERGFFILTTIPIREREEAADD